MGAYLVYNIHPPMVEWASISSFTSINKAGLIILAFLFLDMRMVFEIYLEQRDKLIWAKPIIPTLCSPGLQALISCTLIYANAITSESFVFL